MVGAVAFAERILPRASDLWVQASLDYKQRFSSCFFRKARRSTEIDSIEPPYVTTLFAPSEGADERVVSRIFASWNQLDRWLRQVEGLRRVA